MRFSLLGFIFSYKCNFICEHCSVNASPLYTEVLEFDLVKKAIDEAYLIPSFKVISFTGGEVTLFFERLKNAISYAKDKGFITRVVTNGWWGYSFDNAMRIAKELASAGLDEINISFDDFHMKFYNKLGGISAFLNAVRASYVAGLRIAVSVTKVNNSKIDANYVKSLLEKEGIDNIEIIEDFITLTGRAREKFKSSELPRRNIPNNVGCPYVGDSIMILPDGRVTVCCGHIINVENAKWLVSVGNIKNETLTELISKIRRNVLFWYIYLKGPQTLARKFDTKLEFNSLCEACYLLATRFTKELEELAKRKNEIANCLIRGDDIDEVIGRPDSKGIH